MTRARLVSLAAAMIAVAACSDSPTAPTPASSPGAAVDAVVTVRSGADGFPPLAGAEVRAGSIVRTTDAAGRAVLGPIDPAAPMPKVGFEVRAAGHVSFVSRLDLRTTITLWPIPEGGTAWIYHTSYISNGAAEFLVLPMEDVRFDLQGELAAHAAVWGEAGRIVTEAARSGNPAAPGARLAVGDPDATRFIIRGTPCPVARCQSVSSGRVHDPEHALEMIAPLVGFDLGRGRALTPALEAAGGQLHPVEREALRMRFLRLPGAIWGLDVEHEHEWWDGMQVRQRP
jgi:hypothetical protein